MKYKSARHAMWDYFHLSLATHEDDTVLLGTRVQTTSRGGCGLTWNAIELGAICRDLNERKLGPAAYIWVRHCYEMANGNPMMPGRWVEFGAIKRVSSLSAEIRDRSGIKITAKNVRQVRRLSEVAIANVAKRVCNGESYTPAQICRMSNVAEKNWHSTWLERFDLFERELDKLDARSCKLVAQRIAALTQEEGA